MSLFFFHRHHAFFVSNKDTRSIDILPRALSLDANEKCVCVCVCVCVGAVRDCVSLRCVTVCRCVA